MNLPIEFVRRRRIFHVGMYVLSILLAADLLGGFAHVLSTIVAVVVLMVVSVGVLAWMHLALRWVQVVQPAVTLSPTAELRYAQARRLWIARRGTLLVGIPWGVAMAALMNRHELMADAWLGRFVVFGLALLYWVPVGMLCGWVSARFMWRVMTPKVVTESKSVDA